MFKVLILSLFIGVCVCRPQQSPEQIQQDIDQFKASLQVKYEETKNAGRDGFQQFLNYLQEQKGRLDHQYEQYREQQQKADEIRLKVQDLAQYLRELKEKAVDDAVGWTQESADAANALWEQIKHYERIPKEQIVRTRRDVSSHAQDARDSVKNAAKDAKDSASESVDHVKEDIKEGHRTRRSDDAESHAGQAWDHAKEAASKAWDHSKDSASSAAHRASDAAEQAYDASKDEAGAAFDHAKESVKSAFSDDKHDSSSDRDHSSAAADSVHDAKEDIKSAEDNFQRAKSEADRERHP